MSIWSTDPETKAAEQNQWLSEDNNKILLCDIIYDDLTAPGTASKQVGYFSTYHYVTLAVDPATGLPDSFIDPRKVAYPDTYGALEDVSHISYIDNVFNIPSIISKIDEDTSIGAIEFLNAEGHYDNYINYAWEGHPIQIYIGEPSWIKDDFIVILDGICGPITSTRPNILALTIRDKREIFNDTVVQETLIVNDVGTGNNYATDLYIRYRNENGEYPFIEPLTNAISKVRGIEVNIARNETAARVAEATALALDEYEDFSILYNKGTSNLTITHVLYGNVEDANDGHHDSDNNLFNTGFSINAENEVSSLDTYDVVFGTLNLNTAIAASPTYSSTWVHNTDTNETALIAFHISTTQVIIDTDFKALVDTWLTNARLTFYNSSNPHIEGDDNTSEVTYITTVADVNSSLSGKYFHIHAVNNDYYIWYNVNNATEDPDVNEEEYIQFDDIAINNASIPETAVDTPVPICLGYCFNLSPKLIDTYNHVYQIHEYNNDLEYELGDVLEVRSNGVPLHQSQYEVNKKLGCIRLLQHQNSTQITCDVIGQKTRSTKSAPDVPGTEYDYYFSTSPHTVTFIVEWLALEKTSLTYSDFCPYAFRGFPNGDLVGMYIDSESKVLDNIHSLMESVGGYERFGRYPCVFQIFRLDDPASQEASLTIGEDSILEKGLRLSATEPPNKVISLGYKYNWTVQDKSGLAGLITDFEDLDEESLEKYESYTSEYLTVSTNNSGIENQYPLAKTIDTKPTYYYYKSAAYDEVIRQILIRNTKRFIYTVECIAAPLTVSIGDIVNIVFNRFGFTYGRNCLVIGIEESPTKQRVKLEVWL